MSLTLIGSFVGDCSAVGASRGDINGEVFAAVILDCPSTMFCSGLSVVDATGARVVNDGEDGPRACCISFTVTCLGILVVCGLAETRQ